MLLPHAYERLTALKGELLHTWHSLLLVHTDLSQDFRHLTASSKFAGRIASIVAQFFIQIENTDVQVRRIQFTHKLWAVMKNVFSDSWLPPPAEIILAAILRRRFTLADDRVKTAWSQLCAELVSVGIPTLLHVVYTRSQLNEGLEVTRQLWMVLARSFQDPNDNLDWNDLICFLVIPLK